MSKVKEYNPFFEVTRQPLFTRFGDKEIRSSRDALINPELGVIVGEVGKNYKVVTNNEVAEVFDTAFADVPKLFTRDHLNGTTGSWVREVVLNDPEFGFVVDGNDECKVRVSIFNGYTGKKSVGFKVSAYRLICKNGMMGWSNLLSVSIPHIKEGIIDTIRDEFHTKINVLRNKIDVFTAWTDERFTQNDFNLFVDTRETLSDKMKDKIKGYYLPIKNKYGEKENRWGAYNVLTAIGSHYTEAQKGSHLFSNAYKRIEKLVNEFEGFDPEEHKEVWPQ